ncbi:MAG: hypothetical protein QM488_18130 [Rhizobiaceae bacterium]
MKLYCSTMTANLLVFIMASVTVLSQSSTANAFDMDCKVILCIAGGFPSTCGDAYSYMIKRITHKPPKPPFGFCAMSNGSEYRAHNVDYRFLYRGPEAYDCPKGAKLYYRLETEDHSQGTEIAFCYSHSTVERSGWGQDEQFQTVYHNQSSAQRVNFQLQITIEPGTQSEFRSPLFRINTSTGYVSHSAL